MAFRRQGVKFMASFNSCIGCEDPACAPPPMPWMMSGCWDVMTTGTCPRGGAPVCKWCAEQSNSSSSASNVLQGKGGSTRSSKSSGKGLPPIWNPAFDKKKGASKGKGKGKVEKGNPEDDPTCWNFKKDGFCKLGERCKYLHADQ
mmetsp:Transcript_46370/g.80732  ORF Transcript_46370/g.80732 Transcript_46370/m.80732 type:complete len:145 (-) Transcript_46370:81-515(-)